MFTVNIGGRHPSVSEDNGVCASGQLRSVSWKGPCRGDILAASAAFVDSVCQVCAWAELLVSMLLLTYLPHFLLSTQGRPLHICMCVCVCVICMCVERSVRTQRHTYTHTTHTHTHTHAHTTHTQWILLHIGECNTHTHTHTHTYSECYCGFATLHLVLLPVHDHCNMATFLSLWRVVLKNNKKEMDNNKERKRERAVGYWSGADSKL